MAIAYILKVIHSTAGCMKPPYSNFLDPFRHTPVRALGHCYALGEASRYHYSEDVNEHLSHVATAYIICHAMFQAYNANGGGKASLTAFFDSLIYDSLASGIIPCALIVHIIRVSSVVFREIYPVPAVISRWGPVITGIAALVFTYPTIDRCVDQALDETLRNLY